MSESSVAITEGSGRRFHTWQRTISAVAVEDAFQLPGEQPAAAYAVGAVGLSLTTADVHLLQIMAGPSAFVRVRRIVVQQKFAATAGYSHLEVVRLTTAGTGGTAVTPAPFDLADPAAGASAQTLPSTKGTEGVVVMVGRLAQVATDPTTTDHAWEWEASPGTPGIVIPAGWSNGIAVKFGFARLDNSCAIFAEFVETAWLGD